MEFVLEGKCDKTRYYLGLGVQKIHSVAYRDLSLPKNGRRDIPVRRAYYVPPDAKLLPVTNPFDELVPDTEVAAYWYTRAVYENLRKPVYYFYPQTNLLIVFPPPPNDGDRIIIKVAQDDLIPADAPQPDSPRPVTPSVQ